MGLGGALLPMLALSLAGSTYLIRHNEQQLYPVLFLFTTTRVFAALFGAYFTYNVFIYPYFLSPLRHIPGPTSYNPILGLELAAYGRPRGGPYTEWMETIPNDGLLHLRGFLNRDILVPTTPAALAEVLNNKSYDFIKPPALQKFLARILGWGVLLSEGQLHKFQRKNLMPAFHLRHVRELTAIFWVKAIELVEKMGSETKNGELRTEFGDWASRATLDIIGVAGMGHDFRAIQEPHQEVVEKFNTLLEPSVEKGIFFAANIFFPMWLVKLLPWKLNDDLIDVSSTLNRLAHSLVEEKKAKLAAAKERTDKDILSVALESGAFTNNDMVDQLLTFLAAGHETTASALTWAIWMVSIHPEVQTRLRAEVRKSIPSPKTADSEAPNWEDMEALPYLNAVCSETLRYLPTVSLTSRQTARNTTILDQFVPKGTRVLIVPWANNKSTALWGPSADKFDPERYMGAGASNGGASNIYAFMSFLHGPRSCIGQTFARGEFKVLLAVLVGRFSFEMQNKDEKIEIGGVITTKPGQGMNIILRTVPGW